MRDGDGLMRPPLLLHTASEPLALFGREAERALLDAALRPDGPSVVALIGPGGQGKTAIVQTWRDALPEACTGVLFWSFYQVPESERCLRTWLAYAQGTPDAPEVSSSFAAQQLLALLRRERWAVVLDGVEVVQQEGKWHGRLVHPDLAWLLAELANEPMPGVVVLTSRFAFPELTARPYFRAVALDRLTLPAARALLRQVGVAADTPALDALAQAAGCHAKAVELLGTLQVAHGVLPPVGPGDGDDDLEATVGRVLVAWQPHLTEVQRDLITLATAFRTPPDEPTLLEFLTSEAVEHLRRERWQRPGPAPTRAEWESHLDMLIRWRLLERVGAGVIEAHPLVRRGFERDSTATARAGFLRGRPDRRPPATLDDAATYVEAFHAFIDAGNFAEADALFVRLENPKHRLLAPALEVSLLERFFPDADVLRTPLWPGFGRWRSLAIALEMLGRYEEALAVYRPGDAGLRGDALIALGRFAEITAIQAVPAPWNPLWQACRAHALARLGRPAEALALARRLVPSDIYDWLHVGEVFRRTGQASSLDLRGLPTQGSPWTVLAARRLRADLGHAPDATAEYRTLTEAYDRAGLPYERTLVRLRLADLTGEGHAEANRLIERYGLVGLREQTS
jgi:tetratricopeptide (TPR) repeat protein